MKKNNFYTALSMLTIGFLLSISIATTAQTANINAATGVQFKSISLDSAFKLAKKENKSVFISLFATWCGWCTTMKSKTYTNKALGDYFNTKFISVRINGEKGEGRKIVKKYGITAYPAQLVVNYQGQLVTGSIGYKKPADLLKEIKDVFN